MLNDRRQELPDQFGRRPEAPHHLPFGLDPRHTCGLEFGGGGDEVVVRFVQQAAGRARVRVRAAQ